MSERRSAINTLLASDSLSDEQRAELDGHTKGLAADEIELRAAIAADPEPPVETGDDAPEDRERVELRKAASLAEFVGAAVSGRPLQGASAELAAEINLGTGYVPLEMFAVERRAAPVERRALSEAPGDVGVNLDPIIPAIFARSVCPRLGIDMPRVKSGTYATGTITGNLTAAAKGKNDAATAQAATITTATTTPHRVSARLSIALEDIASVGTENFEASLRQNLSLALSAQLDSYALTGDGQGPNPEGLLDRLSDPNDPTAAVDWAGFVSAVADGIDGGPWAEGMPDIRLLVNAETMRLAETTFRAPSAVGTPVNTYSDTPGETSAAAYLRAHSGGFFCSSRMPDTASTIAQAIRYRPGTNGLDGVDAVRTAVCPVWSEMGIDDIYTDSAKGVRHVTFHVLVGDVIVTQTDAYQRVDLKVSA